MALKDCPECGEQVSNFALTCPHCGCNYANRLFWLLIYWIIGVAIGVASVNYLIERSAENGQPPKKLALAVIIIGGGWLIYYCYTLVKKDD